MDDDIEVADSPASFPCSVVVGHLSKMDLAGVDTFVLLELVYEDGGFPVCFRAQDAMNIGSALVVLARQLGAVEE
jgi:hypothetical protein